MCVGVPVPAAESTDDLTANGMLSGNNGIKWAAHSIQQHQTAVITSYLSGLYNSDDTKLQVYGDDALQFIGQTTLPQFSIGSTSVAGYGQFVLWNTAESKMIVVEQADSTSGLVSDYAVYTLDASGGPANCSYQLSTTQLSVGAAGGSSNSIGVTDTTHLILDVTGYFAP